MHSICIQFQFMIPNNFTKVKQKEAMIIFLILPRRRRESGLRSAESLLKNPFPGGKIETYFCIKKVFLNIHSTSMHSLQKYTRISLKLRLNS